MSSPAGTASGGSTAPLLEIRGARLEVGDRVLMDGAGLEVHRGDCVALIGRNGAGKTTLLRAALGLVRPAAGEIRLGDAPVAALSPRERSARVAWLPQRSTVREALPSWEVVAAARFRFRESEATSRQRAAEALAALGVAHLAARSFPSLSGGEQQRVALAALLAQDAPLLLLDEPGNHLDPAAQIDTYRRIRHLREDGRAILCVSHDVNLLPELARGPEEVRLFGVVDQRLEDLGTLADPRLGDALSAVFGCPFASVEVNGRRIHVPAAPSPEARAR